MVSMKDISVRCGVSVATVSKALNDHSDISDATKKMVRACIYAFVNSLILCKSKIIV